MSVESNNTAASSVELHEKSYAIEPLKVGGSLESRTLYEIDTDTSAQAPLEQLVPSHVSHIVVYDPVEKKSVALRRKMNGTAYLPTFETWQGATPPSISKGSFLSKLAEVGESQAMISNDTRSQLSGLAQQVGLGDNANKAFGLIDKLKVVIDQVMSLLKRYFPMAIPGDISKSAKGSAEEELSVFESYVHKFPPTPGMRQAKNEGATEESKDTETHQEKVIAEVDEAARAKGLETLFPDGTPKLLLESHIMKQPLPSKAKLAEARTYLHNKVFTRAGKTLPAEVVMKSIRDTPAHQEQYATWLRWRYKEIRSKEAYQKTTFGKLAASPEETKKIADGLQKVDQSIRMKTLADKEYAAFGKVPINKYTEPLSTKPLGLVAHITDTPNFSSTMQAFRTNNNFTQYVIDRDGTIVKLMPDLSVVAAASTSDSVPSLFNGGSYVHVECIAQGSPDNLTPAQRKSLVALAKVQMQTHGFGLEQVIGHGVLYPASPTNGRHDKDFGYPDVKKLHKEINKLSA